MNHHQIFKKNKNKKNICTLLLFPFYSETEELFLM